MPETMTEQYKKLREKLHEIFQLDRADLDFGIYRIMNMKRDQIVAFLDDGLLPQVKAALAEYQSGDKDGLRKELAELEKSIQDAGMNPDGSPKVADLRARLAAPADATELEDEVYSHLYNFFRRYYHEGDFISQRRYKEGIYAIPYEGEEVKLHWANHDQYYIKTSEYLRDYTFRLGDGKRVHFKLVEATTEKDNVKAQKGKERRFALVQDEPVVVESGEAVIRFTYLPNPEKQADLNAQAVELLKAHGVLAKDFRGLLAAAPTEANPNRTVLEKHLAEYTARNTFDYFIHKNLGKFLRTELDFFIKNEVLHLDDVDAEGVGVGELQKRLAKIKALRRIALKLIDFLAQLEDFQKKLWLKKKFVIETNYLVTLDRIPEELYPEIAANDKQREEWVRLFAIDEIKGSDGGDMLIPATPGYSVPLSVEFLKANRGLVVDTGLFGRSFQIAVVDHAEKLDEQASSLLVNSENYQALRLMTSRNSREVRGIYIDPPYNTGGDGFMYHDSYKHSSWISMMQNRLEVAHELLHDLGVMFVSIDAEEANRLETTMTGVFGETNRVEEIIWVTNANKNRSPTYSTNHEYVQVFARDLEAAKKETRLFREPKQGYNELHELVTSLAESYPPISEIAKGIRNLFKRHKEEVKALAEEVGLSPDDLDDWKGLYNYTHAEYRDSAGAFVLESEARERQAQIWVWREDNPSMPQVKEDSQKDEFRDPDHPAFRFYTPKHPVTGKPCPHPKTGWRWPRQPLGKQHTCFDKLLEDNRIAWGDDETKIPQTKRFLHEVETNVAKSVTSDFTDGEKEMADLFGKSRVFSNPKPSTLIGRFCNQTTWSDHGVMDFFAGSGTTGQAVLTANRTDGSKRRFTLVEQGDHFDTVLRPRIAKVVYCDTWKDGKPQNRTTGVSHLCKVIRLESYEDALANLSITPPTGAADLLDPAPDSLGEDYLLRYMMEEETKGSASLLNVHRFADPTAYRLAVKAPGTDATREVAVDLLETFNWLIGLRVDHIAAPQTFAAEFERDGNDRLTIKGDRLRKDDDGAYWFRTVTGWVRENLRQPHDSRRLKVLIIWRKLTGDPEADNLALDHYMRKQRFTAKDLEFDLIYVNGDNNLENLKRDDETWKVRLIEEDFQKLMFDAEDV